MSIFTEEEAKQHICPKTFTMIPVQGVGGVSMQLVSANCQASKCAVWRTGYRFGCDVHVRRDGEIMGYCGLGNGPRG